MIVHYAHLAPKDTLAAVERLDASTEPSTDTTTDTGVLQLPAMQTAVLQYVSSFVRFVLPGPGGGMADAEDLKSSGDFSS
jgi:hypothetical protein